MKLKNSGRIGSLSQNGIKKSSDKQKTIRPALKLSEAARALHTISSTSQVQMRVPSANMASPGEPSGRILSPRASNLSSNATPTQLPSPVTDRDTDQDVKMILPSIEATSVDHNTASIWVDSINQGARQLSRLYSMTRTDSDRSTEPSETEIKKYVPNMCVFLLYLKHEVEPRPILKEYGLDKALKLILGPNMEALKKRAPDLLLLAKQVWDKYEADEWGVDFSDHEEEIETDVLGSAVVTSNKKGKQKSGPNRSNHTEEIQLPPVSHPIWGREGIMHGLARRTTDSGRVVPIMDPRYHQRNAKVFGHNVHTPGAWWPFQKGAHFHGAHGSSQAGITGDPDLGACSIVVSLNSAYRDLNKDMGTELWYSANKSAKNTNPLSAKTSNPTRSLEISWKTGKPIRVLRHGGTTQDSRRNPMYPTVGIRYDGLYKVIDEKPDTNKHGGMFKKFKLVRLPDSENDGVSWEEVQRYPTREQLRQFDKIKDGY